MSNTKTTATTQDMKLRTLMKELANIRVAMQDRQDEIDEECDWHDQTHYIQAGNYPCTRIDFPIQHNEDRWDVLDALTQLVKQLNQVEKTRLHSSNKSSAFSWLIHGVANKLAQLSSERQTKLKPFKRHK